MNTSQPVIAVEGLTKSYRGVVGVQDLTFTVEQGEVFGFLGPNGAGKTTCIRLLLDLLRPDAGRIFMFGHELAADRWRFKRRVGNLPGEVAWWPGLSGREILDFFGRLRPGRSVRREELLDRLGLDRALLARKVRTYSRGTRRKLGLVVAMQHDPDLLILDEPTSGLDPLVRHAFFGLCRAYRDAGKTVMLSSHNLAETQQVCDRVAIVRAGRLAAVERIDVLKGKAARRVEATFDTPPAAEWFDLPGVQVLEIRGATARLSCRGSPASLVGALARRPLKDLIVAPPALEDLFLHYFEEPKDAE